MLYFAIVVYSLYKDLSEGNKSNTEETSALLSPRNWDTALTAYTNHNLEQGMPINCGDLQSLQ
jgi:hypothetical protein